PHAVRLPSTTLFRSYRSQLPVPEQADRSITLTLSADGHARLEVVVDRGETTTSRGFWRAVDGRLTVMVDRLDGRGRGPLVFEIEEGRLVPTSFDGALYGEQPIPLVRRSAAARGARGAGEPA